jgi:ATP-binding cassette subfamily C (CFTR/MRP) protein 1
MTKLRGALISLIYNRILVIADGASRDGAALTLISSGQSRSVRTIRVNHLTNTW